MYVTKRDGKKEAFDISKIQRLSAFACEGLDVSQSELEVNMHTKFFSGITTSDIHDAQIISAGELISRQKPDYTFVAARLLLMKVFKEVTFGEATYPTLRSYVDQAIAEKQIDARLANFDLEALDGAIRPERDYLFDYLGMQTVADRYLLRRQAMVGESGKPRLIELPQHFFMRVAMGLALRDTLFGDKLPADDYRITDTVVEFYNVLSTHDALSSTPTLFNSGTLRPQMSSCYLNTVLDSLLTEGDNDQYASIYGTITECAALSKFAGGIGTDWTRVRGRGDPIKGTNGKSNGIVPFLKVYNDTAIAVNQGGKRLGSFAPYLEVWHPDFMDYTELRKNSGDERARAHDIFPVSWTCDLFMKRVQENGVWSFFSPYTFPELHELYGEEFEKRYLDLENRQLYVRQLPAMEVWKKIITMLWETGHPWVTFKDECNRRNPQDHVGVIHSSNLCTEITLNTSDDETAVCNLASINLANHIIVVDGVKKIDFVKLRRTIRTVMRMLDNVIDVNFYPSQRAANANMRHRPVGMGVMGMSDMMAALGIAWDSQENLEFEDELFEAWSYYAIEASADLAQERGAYETFHGSKWSLGILPVDTAKKEAFELTKHGIRMDWDALREKVQRGMRNSNCMAIAPTATISNISNTVPCIEPPFQLEYTKTNLSGTFTVVSSALRYGETIDAFSVPPTRIIQAAAVRQKWIDQSQSVNIFVKSTIKGRDLSELYFLAWVLGLKTTYYLRREIEEIEDVKEKIRAKEEASEAQAAPQEEEAPVKFCSIDNPNCESCQ